MRFSRCGYTHQRERGKKNSNPVKKSSFASVCVGASPSTLVLVLSVAKKCLERNEKKMRDLMGEEKAGKWNLSFADEGGRRRKFSFRKGKSWLLPSRFIVFFSCGRAFAVMLMLEEWGKVIAAHIFVWWVWCELWRRMNVFQKPLSCGKIWFC